MFDEIRIGKKYGVALAALEKATGTTLSQTSFETELKKYFMAFSKGQSFSDEASIAMALNIYLLKVCEAEYELREHGTSSLEVSSRFMGIPTLKKMVEMWETIAVDRAKYDQHVGMSLKTEFNEMWKRLEQQQA
jgi:hypothetical protein